MKQRLGAIMALCFCASVLGVAVLPTRAQTAQTPGTVYCKQPQPYTYGQLGSTTQMNKNEASIASCSVNPGYFWSDGPLAVPSPSPTGFSFAIPQMTWFVKGSAVITPAQTLGPVAANSTSYWWLDVATGNFTGTTLNTPPTTTSDLEFTVVSNGSGVTGVTPANATAMTVPSITLGNLSASSCVGTNGSNVISSNTSCVKSLVSGAGVNAGSGSTPTIALSPLPVPPSEGGIGPSPSATAGGCTSSVTRSGASGSDVITVPICPTPNASATGPISISGTYPTIQVGCAALPLSCGQVFWGPSYGMAADSGTTDNGVALTAAYVAACNASRLGGTILIPYSGAGYYGFSTPVRHTCSNVTLAGFGPGSGFGSSHYPTPATPATTFECTSNLGGSPILSLNPTAAAEQAGNAVIGIGFSGNNDLCSQGLYVTGNQQVELQRLSFVHFSGYAFELAGSQLGGSATGSVVHPHLQSIQITQSSSGDGHCMLVDAYAVGGVDFGDVFGGNGGNVSCVYYNWPGIVIARSDHIAFLDDVQSKNVAGAPTPTPAPSGSPSPTPFPDIVVICGATQDYLGNTMGGIAQYNAEPATPTSPEPSCAPPAGSPRNTSISRLQSFGNSAIGPRPDVGTIAYLDDNYDLFEPIGNFICLGAAAFNKSGCDNATLTPIIENDGNGNLAIGMKGGGVSGNILLGPGGLGNGSLPSQEQSWIDSSGCYDFGLFPTVTSQLCQNALHLNTNSGLPGVVASAYTNFNWGSYNGYNVGIAANGTFTPVPSPTPAPTASPAAGYLSVEQDTGNTSISTNGTTGNTYVQVGSDITGTTGVSNGTGWYGVATLHLQVGNNVSGENFYGCIKTASSVTTKVGDHQGGSVCATSDTGMKAGTALFGQQATSNGGQFGNAQYKFTIANSTAYDFVCEAAGSTTTVTTVYGWCSVELWPY